MVVPCSFSQLGQKARQNFPIFQEFPQLVYFDSAATNQKPQSVINAICQYYSQECGTVHRAIYHLASQATEKYAFARARVAQFLHARSEEDIVFTGGTTASINLVALALERNFFSSGDEIIINEMEHHANIVPWQMLASRLGLSLKYVNITENAEFDIEHFKSLLSDKTRLVAIAHVANSTGSVNPVEQVVQITRSCSTALVLIDGAQAVAHIPVDLQNLDPDFYVFSGHKMFGPTGIGVLYIKASVAEHLQPVFGGGDMVLNVSKDASSYQQGSLRFEAGTPAIAQVLGLRAAIDYIEEISITKIQAWEESLHQYALAQLQRVSGIQLIGRARNKIGIISFHVPGVHSLDIAVLLDSANFAVRSGHHCAQLLVRKFNVESTCRLSFSVFNTHAEIDHFVDSLQQIIQQLHH